MRIEKIAHRGASREAPENTLLAFELAFQKYHCDYVEMDVRLTRDGVPVIFHDPTLERVTNVQGQVCYFSKNEIQRLDAGFGFDPSGKKEFPYRGKGIRIPTLEEVLTRFSNQKFFIEMKDRGASAAQKVLGVIRLLGAKTHWVIGSFHGPTMRAFRTLAGSSVETFLAEDEVLTAYVRFRLGSKKITLPGRFASLPRGKYRVALDDPRWIQFLHHQGAKVYYWTVNEQREMDELLGRGADGIVTDYPDRLSALISGTGPTNA